MMDDSKRHPLSAISPFYVEEAVDHKSTEAFKDVPKEALQQEVEVCVVCRRFGSFVTTKCDLSCASQQQGKVSWG